MQFNGLTFDLQRDKTQPIGPVGGKLMSSYDNMLQKNIALLDFLKTVHQYGFLENGRNVG